MMPLLMFRLPISIGSSFTDSGFLFLATAVCVVVLGVSFLVASLEPGVCSLAVVVCSLTCAGALGVVAVWVDWAKLAIEPAINEETSKRAVATREKLFI